MCFMKMRLKFFGITRSSDIYFFEEVWRGVALIFDAG